MKKLNLILAVLVISPFIYSGEVMAVNHVDNEPGMSFKSPAHEIALKATSEYSMNEVKYAQKSLQKQGYYSGELDGVMGPQTSQALLRYQVKNDLHGSGMLDETTFRSLKIRLNRLENNDRAAEIYSE
jgi:hypothetical protein